ncbi:MAG: hypothetical protein JST26_05275 [Bacteroidetes bacterium]|nr:hypothetical protein [Bacteroidota bacterium]
MDTFKTGDIYKLLLAHWKKLAIVAVIAIVASSVISSPWVMKPKYKSRAVVFPTNLSPFSEESNTEQLLQFFMSDEIKDRMAKRFNLYQYYDIDSTDSRARSFYNYKYQENFKISNTLYESVEVEVMDHLPAKAQELANGLLEEVNLLIEQSKKEKVSEYLKNYGNLLLIKRNEIDSLEARLKNLRMTYGLLDIKAQAKEITKRQGKQGLSETDKVLLTGLKEKSGEFQLLQSEIKQQVLLYKDIKKEYDKNLMDYHSKISYTTVVSKPDFPDKKCYPVRWAIVTAATLSALLLAILVIIVLNKKQRDLA